MNDRQRFAERLISRTLRTGVIVSAGLMIVGIARELVDPGASGVTDPLVIVSSALSGAVDSPGLAALSFGILALMLTPVVRVLAALVTFILERDRAYSLIAAAILAMFVLEILFSLT